jgi:hypothetical protein
VKYEGHMHLGVIAKVKLSLNEYSALSTMIQGLIKTFRDKIFCGETTNSIEVTTM